MAFAPARSQFGDPALSQDEALSACGPAAALAFARVNNRFPTLREAVDLAKTVGWTQSAGMAGAASEQALLKQMGVEAELTPAADWGRVQADVQGGKPVIISTPRHYFTVSDHDPQSGKFFVGTSGTDLRGGSEWMSADEITSAGRGINGALHLAGDLPVANTPVPAEGQPPARPPATSSRPAPVTVAQARALDIKDATPTPGTEASPEGAASQNSQKPVETPEQARRREWLAGMKGLDSYSRHLMGQFTEPTALASPYTIPGLGMPDIGWAPPKRFTLPDAVSGWGRG